MSKTADWREAFSAAMAYETQGCQFTAALGIRDSDGEIKPLVPVHSKVHHDLESTKDGFGFTRYYAAVPNHEFVVPVRCASGSPHTEYGFFVYLDQGEEPETKNFDHYHWWGPNPQKSDRTLLVNGYYKNPTQSRAMRFAPTHDVEDNDNGPSTEGKRPRTRGAAPRGSPPGDLQQSPRRPRSTVPQTEEERLKTKDQVGWIVLRFHKVLRYKPAASGEQGQVKRARLGPEAKPALTSTSGQVINDEGAQRYTEEPEFDKKAIFEFRIRYNNFDAIRREATTKGGASMDSLELGAEYFRAIPLEALLGHTAYDKQLREYCLLRMMSRAQKLKNADGENVAVSLVEVLRQINTFFDDTAAKLLCSSDDERQRGGALALEAAYQYVQGKPCYVRNLEHETEEADEEVQISALSMSEAGEYERKLSGLRCIFEDPFKYELCAIPGVAAGASSSTMVPGTGISPRGLAVKHAIISLDSDDDD